MTTLATEAAQAADRAEPGSTDLFTRLDSLPETRLWRAESLDGETVTLSPTPVGRHGRNLRELERQLAPHLPQGTDDETRLEIRMHHLQRSVTPDLFVAPEEVLDTSSQHWIGPDDVLLVAEVTSRSNAGADREAKRGIYARAGIEFYLLIDPLLGKATLYAGPEGDDYRDRAVRNFGEKLAVPEPFDFVLDTSRLRAY
ncbi:Uma2 family endonuclease [Thermobifida halotolerans]|nr:Uma2 family endonuclease [Thermobifida halotolerans]